MNSQTMSSHAELRDPDEFESDLDEDVTPLGLHSAASLQPPRRSILHRRSGTGTNLSVNSISTKKTALGIGRRALGLCLLFLTISLWTSSNFLASSIFADGEYSKPYFVTWLNVGFFSVFLLRPLAKSALQGTGILPAWTRSRPSAQMYSPVATSSGRAPAKFDDDEDTDEQLSSMQSSRQALMLDESMVLSTHGFDPEDTDKLSLGETARLAVEFSVYWFLCNYFISACLQYTTVASSTVISSTSSIFTLGLGVLLGTEIFTLRKLISVAVCLVGVIMVSQVDLSGESDENRGSFPEKSAFEMAIGDMLALASAMCYAVYTTVLKKRVADESRIDVPTFFGFIGLYSLLFFWPGLLILHWTGVEPFEAPPPGTKVWGIILVNGVISVVSDVCWTYSMLLTSPLVITVGLSLAIPLSLLGQMLINGQSSSLLYWVGCVVVAVSFVVVNQENKREAAETDWAITSAIIPPAIVVDHDDGGDNDGHHDEDHESDEERSASTA